MSQYSQYKILDEIVEPTYKFKSGKYAGCYITCEWLRTPDRLLRFFTFMDNMGVVGNGPDEIQELVDQYSKQEYGWGGLSLTEFLIAILEDKC